MGLLMTVKRREIRADTEMDTKTGCARSPDKSGEKTFLTDYEGTEMSREVKRASERPGGIIWLHKKYTL